MAKRKKADAKPKRGPAHAIAAGSLAIENRAVESLTLDPTNARKHNARNLEAIKGSLAEFGQTKPIVVADGVVIAGNGTLMAARELGWPTIATVDVSALTPTQRRAYALADNRTAELAEWDDAELSAQLKALVDEDFDLAAIGFSDEDMASIEGDFAEDASGLPARIAAESKPYTDMNIRVMASERLNVESALRDAAGGKSPDPDISVYSYGLLRLCGLR